MGRGSKSGHDRKEQRKEKHAEAKGAKYEKSTRKVTKGSLKKEFKAKQAVADSFKAASSISMDRKEENMLLELIAMLDNVSIEPARVTFGTTDKVRTFEVEKDTIRSAADLNTLIGEANESDSSTEPEVCPQPDSKPDQNVEHTSEHASETENSSESDSSDSSSSSESDSDSYASESDSSEKEAPAHRSKTEDLPTNEQGQAVIGRNKYIRRLIRDERRYIRDQQKANLVAPSAERVVARLKQSLQSNNTLNTTTSYATTSATSTTTIPNVSNTGFAYKPHKDKTTPSKPAKPTLSASVRVSAHFDKSGDGSGRTGAAKLVVIQRNLPLADILDVFRTKFKATALVSSTSGTAAGSSGKVYKYTAVRIVSSGELLDAFSMLTLPDGEALTLFSSSDVMNSVGSVGSVVSAGSISGVSGVSGVGSESKGKDDYRGSGEGSYPADGPTSSTDSKATASATNTTNNMEESSPIFVTTTTAAPTYWTPPVHTSASKPTTNTKAETYNTTIRTTLTTAYKAPSYTNIHAIRTALPIFAHKSELLDTINTNPVVVVSGETGSGKTTQLPLYLMEHMIKNNNASRCNIVCTQPRRIAAISVAERVNYECAQPGAVGTGLVGYQVRLDSRVCDETLLTYCTTGVLLRKLQNASYLSTVSHIILDEVHERGVETDFLMTLLKQQYHKHPHLRIILMSATMQENLFPSYFNNCPIVYVSGRTFPISMHYIEEVHEVVARGQRLLAVQRGKIPQDSNNNTVTTDTSCMDRDSAAGKKGYKGKHPRLAPDDPAVLKQRPPKFNAELIAELVIRIITTTNSKNSGATVVGVGDDAGARVSTSSSVSASACASSGDTNTPSSGGVKRSNRLGGIQNAASNIRSTTTPTTNATTVTTTTTATSVAPTPTTNTTNITATTTTTAATASEGTGDAILVFLSGIQSIEKVNKALRQRGVLQGLKAQVHILHGSQSPEQQKRVFRRTAPGEWKIVLATNIAETSITVSDVTHVVDAGYVKELRFDPAGGISSLQEVFVSRAAAQQRAGRAGRVRAGHCWRVYSQEYFESTRVEAFPLPEIQRVPLEEVVLQVLLLNLGTPESFLSQCLQPPSIEQIRQSIAVLIEIRAVLPVPDLPLTALGYHLARMPVDVRIGKMLIYASLLGVVEPLLTIAAALGGKSPFLTPIDSMRAEAQLSHSRFLYEHNKDTYAYSGSGGGSGAKSVSTKSTNTNNNANSSGATGTTSTSITNPAYTLTNPLTTHTTTTNHYSDHIALIHCYNQFIYITTTSGSDAAYRYCKERYLNFSVLNEMRALREHFRAYLRQTGLLNSSGTSGSGTSGSNGSGDIEIEVVDIDLSELQLQQSPQITDAPLDYALIKCALCAGLYPNIVRLGRFKEPTNNAKLTPNKHNHARANLVQKMVQSDLSEVSLHPSCLISSQTSRILDYMEQKTTTTATTTDTNTTNDGSTSPFGGSSVSNKSHYSMKDESTGTKDAFLVYYKKMTINKLFLFDATLVPHASILLFSNTELVYNHKTHRVTVSGWIEMKITELHCILYRRLQREIEGLLRCKVENPSEDIAVRQRNLVYIVGMLLV